MRFEDLSYITTAMENIIGMALPIRYPALFSESS
jgi:hypothetical protein